MNIHRVREGKKSKISEKSRILVPFLGLQALLKWNSPTKKGVVGVCGKSENSKNRQNPFFSTMDYPKSTGSKSRVGFGSAVARSTSPDTDLGAYRVGGGSPVYSSP